MECKIITRYKNSIEIKIFKIQKTFHLKSESFELSARDGYLLLF